jgi:hypothetical protein
MLLLMFEKIYILQSLKLKRPPTQLRPHQFWTYTSNLTTVVNSVLTFLISGTTSISKSRHQYESSYLLQAFEETPTQMNIKINRLEEEHNSYPLVCQRPAKTVSLQRRQICYR